MEIVKLKLVLTSVPVDQDGEELTNSIHQKGVSPN